MSAHALRSHHFGHSNRRLIVHDRRNNTLVTSTRLALHTELVHHCGCSEILSVPLSNSSCE